MLNLLWQAAQQAPPPGISHEVPNWMQHVLNFIDTPAPYSPFSEYLAVLFLLWLLARRSHSKKDFSAEAQQVLDEKFKQGEIDRATYDKYRQELSLRLKKD